MKKKNTRVYGKYPARLGFAEGGTVYDDFGDPIQGHINEAGGLTVGEDPRKAKHFPGKVSGTSCWSETSTFDKPTSGYVPGATLSGGLPEKKGGGGGGGGMSGSNMARALALADKLTDKKDDSDNMAKGGVVKKRRK